MSVSWLLDPQTRYCRWSYQAVPRDVNNSGRTPEDFLKVLNLLAVLASLQFFPPFPTFFDMQSFFTHAYDDVVRTSILSILLAAACERFH